MSGDPGWLFGPAGIFRVHFFERNPATGESGSFDYAYWCGTVPRVGERVESPDGRMLLVVQVAYKPNPLSPPADVIPYLVPMVELVDEERRASGAYGMQAN